MRRFAVASLMLTACSERSGSPANRGVDRGVLVSAASEADDVIATVDERPIRASDIAAQAKASGVSAPVALDQLVQAELLAGVALERGLAADADVVDARKAAEARRLLQTGFEKRISLDRVPDEMQRKAYESNKLYYDHPDAVEVRHIVASGPTANATAHAKAREKIAQLEPRARAAASDEAFSAIANDASDVPLKAEDITFPKRGVVEDAFADAAFLLEKPGDVSPIVETTYGYHLIRLVRRLPERHAGFEAVRSELRAAAFPAWRKLELDRWLKELSSRWHVEVMADRLADRERSSP